MKTTTELIFTNGTEFMWWQDRNCCRCRKAVWYNEKTDTWPKYKCALQRDIEQQAGGIDEINLRSFNLVHGNDICPMLADVNEPVARNGKGEDEHPSLFTAHDFAQGKQLVASPKTCENDPKSCETPAENAVIAPKKAEIVVNHAMQTQPTSVYATIEMPNIKIDDFLAAAKVTPDQIKRIKEKIFHQAVSDSVESLLKSFTMQEHLRITFAPLVISAMAWMYAERAMKCAADNRIDALKKLSREIKTARDNYIYQLRKDLKPSHIEQINKDAVAFQDKFRSDFFIMHLQCEDELRKMYGRDVDYLGMRADAYIAVILCLVLREHNVRMDDFIRRRMGSCIPTPTNPWMAKLQRCMEAFQGDKPLPFGVNVTMCKQIVHKNIGIEEWRKTRLE